MTCIAYKDGVIAVDRQSTYNGLINETDDKLFILPADKGNVVIAFSGLLSIGFLFKKWYMEGCDRKQWPLSTEIPDQCNFVAFSLDVIEREVHRLVYWDDMMLPVKYDHKIYHALGSGREIALGVMFAGANSETAVRAANHHTDDCGFGVCSVDSSLEQLKVVRV